MPAPEERQDEFYEHLLVRNHGLRDVTFSIGPEAAVFLRGQLDLRELTDEALDRVLGSYYATIEQCFLPALRIGFASRFA